LVDCTAITEVQNSDVDKMKGVIEITILSFHILVSLFILSVPSGMNNFNTIS